MQENTEKVQENTVDIDKEEAEDKNKKRKIEGEPQAGPSKVNLTEKDSPQKKIKRNMESQAGPSKVNLAERESPQNIFFKTWI